VAAAAAGAPTSDRLGCHVRLDLDLGLDLDLDQQRRHLPL